MHFSLERKLLKTRKRFIFSLRSAGAGCLVVFVGALHTWFAQDLFTSKFELSTPSHPYSDSNFRVGWMLFLLGKIELLPPNCDLVTAFHLLIAVLNVLFVHIPKKRLRFNLSDVQSASERTADGRIDTVAVLAAVNHAIPDGVRPLMAKLNMLMIPVFKVMSTLTSMAGLHNRSDIRVSKFRMRDWRLLTRTLWR